MVLCALNMGPNMVSPILPLFIRELNPQGATASAAGLAFCFMGISAAISATVAGRLGGGITLKKMLVFSCLGTGLLYLPPIWSRTVAQLVIFIGLTGLLKGGIMTSSQALVGLSVSLEQQGIAYGLAQSANSLGNGLGPLIGGSLGSWLGLKPVFAVAGGMYMLAGALVTKLLVTRPPGGPS
jgi:DHA1 family multidrug resistance protein-like MFS transporter